MFDDLYVNTDGLKAHLDIISEEKRYAQLLKHSLEQAASMDFMEGPYRYSKLINEADVLCRRFDRMYETIVHIAEECDHASAQITEIIDKCARQISSVICVMVEE